MNPYKLFPEVNLLTEWDKLLELTREQVVSIHDSWIEIHKQNSELSKKLMEEKKEKQQEIDDFMKSNGIDIWNYGRDKWLTRKKEYKSWYNSNVVSKLNEQYPFYKRQVPSAHMGRVEVNGIAIRNNKSPVTIIELYDIVRNQYDKAMAEIHLNDKLLVESIKYAGAKGVDIEGLLSEEIVDIVDHHAKDEYRSLNIPDGTLIHLKHGCSECSSYTVGDHRCSCGNRRIMMEIEGNLVEGYYHYPEAY